VSLKTGRYTHYKGGEYEVYGVARHSESEEELVIYRPLYGESKLWARPRAMFEESLEIDGAEVLRFAFIEGSSAVELTDTHS